MRIPRGGLRVREVKLPSSSRNRCRRDMKRETEGCGHLVNTVTPINLGGHSAASPNAFSLKVRVIYRRINSEFGLSSGIRQRTANISDIGANFITCCQTDAFARILC